MTKRSTNMIDFLVEKRNDKPSFSDNIKWNKNKDAYIIALNELYKLVDKFLVDNFKKAGYKVKTRKEKTNITEVFIGYYEVDKYLIVADNIEITFLPMGTIIASANGRVDMVFNFESIKIILNEADNKWKIVEGIAPFFKLKDFNEKNLLKILKDNL